VIKELRSTDPLSAGPYRLLGRLGAGGMGQVYLARSQGGRLVAVKVIRPGLAEERGFRARFASEIAAARNVSGIYTAAVIDSDPDAEPPWMATAYVPGPSLADAVDEAGPLPVKSVFALAAGLAEALAAIHQAGVVHRDLKPSNVLLAAEGPRVIDFGISRAMERSMLTTTGVVPGSPGFMSPEQAAGKREIGEPADVFSLGAVLTFAATGNGPFGGGPTPALLYRVVNEEPDLGAVPDRLRPLIKRCLAKDPAGRPSPAGLLTLLGGQTGELMGEWLPRTVAEAIGRHRTRFADLPEPAAPTIPDLLPIASLPAPPPFPPEGLAALNLPDGGGAPQSATDQAGHVREWRWPLTAAAAVIAVAAVGATLVFLPGHLPGKPVSGSRQSLLGMTSQSASPAAVDSVSSAAAPASSAAATARGKSPKAPAQTFASTKAAGSASASAGAPAVAAAGKTGQPTAEPTTASPAVSSPSHPTPAPAGTASSSPSASPAPSVAASSTPSAKGAPTSAPSAPQPPTQPPSTAPAVMSYSSAPLSTGSALITARYYFGQLSAVIDALAGQLTFNTSAALLAGKPALCVETVVFSQVPNATGAVYAEALGSGWTAAESTPSPDPQNENLHQQLLVPPATAAVEDTWEPYAEMYAGGAGLMSSAFSLSLQETVGSTQTWLVDGQPVGCEG
jgi:hypothetical protein